MNSFDLDEFMGRVDASTSDEQTKALETEFTDHVATLSAADRQLLVSAYLGRMAERKELIQRKLDELRNEKIGA